MAGVTKSQLNLKINIYRIIRYGLIALLVVIVIIMLSGKKESSASFESVSAAVSGSITTQKAVLNSDRYLKKYFGLNAEEYDGVLIYTPATNMYANEVLLIKLKDRSQADAAAAAIEERIESQRTIFSGYAPDAVGLLENAVLDVQGNYILYITDDQADRVDEVFRNSL
ncbi:MAG: DUF4358 domain-containing protein [Parasporobacterium sp.]|nr:DUF4358 domain-containing protein [Parasporobacterium sp.]